MKRVIFTVGILLIALSSCSRSQEPEARAPVSREFLHEFSESWAKPHNLERLHVSDEYNESDPQIHLHYRSELQLNLDSTRKLFVSLVQELMESAIEKDPSTVLSLDMLDISISFQADEGLARGEGIVAHVYLFDDVLYYSYYESETKKLRKLNTEHYSEAERLAIES